MDRIYWIFNVFWYIGRTHVVRKKIIETSKTVCVYRLFESVSSVVCKRHISSNFIIFHHCIYMEEPWKNLKCFCEMVRCVRICECVWWQKLIDKLENTHITLQHCWPWSFRLVLFIFLKGTQTIEKIQI